MIAAQKERKRQRAKEILAMKIEAAKKSENLIDIVTCIELLMNNSDDSDDSYWNIRAIDE